MFSDSTDAVFQKCQKRLLLLHKLRNMSMKSEMLQSVYVCCTVPVLMFSFISLFSPSQLQIELHEQRVIANSLKSVASKTSCSLENVIMSCYSNSRRQFKLHSHVFQVLNKLH